MKSIKHNHEKESMMGKTKEKMLFRMPQLLAFTACLMINYN